MDKINWRQKIKPWILPIAMLFGSIFHNAVASIQFLAPYLIFSMLFITFCRLRPSEFRFSGLVLWVVAVQVIGSILVYLAISPANEDIAEGAMVCVICPTATAAPVITAMLGGSIATLISISVLTNITAAIVAPILFASVADTGLAQISFCSTFTGIMAKVSPMIVLPLLAAFIMSKVSPRIHDGIAKAQALSFYIWAISLIIVVGRAVTFAMAEPTDRIPEMIALCLVSGIICAAQFYIGRRLGKKFGDRVAGAQGLGQKNTVLAVWMAVSFLNPIASIAPAAYIVWQNTLNSLQIYYKTKRESEARAH